MSTNDAWIEYGLDDDKSGYNAEVESRCSPQEGNESISQNEKVLPEMKSNDPVEARFVQPCVMKVQVPIGASAGDTFIVTPDDGRVFTVVVPEGAAGGAVIEVVLPEEVVGKVDEEGGSTTYVHIKKVTAGAAVAGAIAGGLLCATVGAPILLGGMVCGVGVAAVSSHQSGAMGRTARKIGDLTFANMMKAKRVVERELEIARRVMMR